MDFWWSLSDRLQSSPRFRAIAGAFPPSRPIARRRARAVFDLTAGFVYSQVLLACVQLDLPRILLQGAATTDALAIRLALSPAAATRLLNAAASLRIARRRRGGRFGLGRAGAALIDNPGVTAMIAHHRLLYDDLRDPVALLRGESGPTRLARHWPYAANAAPPDAAEAAAYSALMGASQAMVAEQALAAYDVRRHRVLLDVGGGDGSFLVAAGRRAAGLRLVLFDLPAVAALAQARFARDGLSARATVQAGNFCHDPLPAGADLISLVRVLHDHEDETVRGLLRAARAALAPGGTLLVIEPMAETPGAQAMGDAYFGFYLLAMGSGTPRSARRLQAMLRAAGFSKSRLLATRLPLVTQMIAAS
ncbi:methyltransferase [Lichenicoccus sp.]|uniref:methyltransferase n=1 Tax=Lichenicoccus sp. TaxID=2781899 RepID=UPI003D0BD65A